MVARKESRGVILLTATLGWRRQQHGMMGLAGVSQQAGLCLPRELDTNPV